MFKTSFLYFLATVVMILSIESCLLFKPKSAGLESIQRIENKVDSLTSEEVVGNMSKNAIESAVAGLNSRKSEAELEQLSKELSDKIGKELEGIFLRIDTRTPGVKFAKGVTDSLINKQLENDLLELLNASISRADGNLTVAIKHIEENLASSITTLASTFTENSAVLEDALLNTLSTQLKDSLSLFITEALSNVEFNQFSNQLSTELLSRQFRDTLGEIVLEIKEKLSFESEVEGWYYILKGHFVQAALFIAALVLVVSYMRNTIQYMDRKDSLKEILSNDPKLKKEFENLINEAMKDKNHNA